jgi:conjugative transfer signal peptidase TraF
MADRPGSSRARTRAGHGPAAPSRPRRGAILATLIGCAAASIAGPLLWTPPILLVWNASASAPLGLYRVQPGARVGRGDMVVAWAPAPARKLAAQRRYIPANVPLVKRVAGVAGDRVCAMGQIILINGRTGSRRRRRRDPAGRPMPSWKGCRLLSRGDYFLLMDNPASFDGRYFGLTRKQEIIGKAVLVWAR